MMTTREILLYCSGGQTHREAYLRHTMTGRKETSVPNLKRNPAAKDMASGSVFKFLKRQRLEAPTPQFQGSP